MQCFIIQRSRLWHKMNKPLKEVFLVCNSKLYLSFQESTPLLAILDLGSSNLTLIRTRKAEIVADPDPKKSTIIIFRLKQISNSSSHHS